ncbi:hypothetical protein M0R04_04605 [Candidatus Dojkabacteria bacterium]|jgi:hypothetical protein|nr:hypothetical protein [Candidatus Dojkabacteria bacterium]
MRYYLEKKVYPNIGSRRVIRRFLLLPRIFKDEVRWLEYANILEEYNNFSFECCMERWNEIGFYD